MAYFSQSFDPTVYCSLKVDTAKAKEFIQKMEKETERKISMALLFTKIAGDVLNKYPETNQALKFGAHSQKPSVDISVLVNVGDGKV
jgi:hypothetical protein